METAGAVVGAFDPFTRGHTWLIERGRQIFQTLHIIVVNAPEKRTLFSEKERLDMVSCWVAKSGLTSLKVVDLSVDQVSSYIKEKNVLAVLRTLRNAAEYNSARERISDKPEYALTLYLITPLKFESRAASSVRGMIGHNGWQRLIRRYVPDVICDGSFFDRFKKPVKN